MQTYAPGVRSIVNVVIVSGVQCGWWPETCFVSCSGTWRVLISFSGAVTGNVSLVSVVVVGVWGLVC